MLKLFEACPACGGSLIITECQCSRCRTKIQGQFRPGLFSALTDEQLNFIRIFLAARGNLSETEKQLGVSYPTIRAKLDEINKALERVERETQASQPAPSDKDAERRAVLERVASGELSAAEALQHLIHLQKGQQ